MPPAAFPALAELAPRWRDGMIEFPLHHMRGGTSTGLVIWERYAPADRALREELLRHLMGLPLAGERARQPADHRPRPRRCRPPTRCSSPISNPTAPARAAGQHARPARVR